MGFPPEHMIVYGKSVVKGALCQVLGKDQIRQTFLAYQGDDSFVEQIIQFILLFCVSLAIDRARAVADGQTALWQ